MLLQDLEGQVLEAWADTAGTLDAWREAAAMLFAPGCEAQSFCVLAAFAAPLMALWRHPGGGAVVSFVGPRGAGKATALDAAASVWGHPQAMRLTSYVGDGKYAQIAAFGNLPFIADKLPHLPPESVLALFETFTGPDRAWQTLLLTAGPAAILSEQRFGLELPLKVPAALINRKDKRALAGRLLANRGHAGFCYLQELLVADRLDWAQRQLRSTYAALKDRYGDEPDRMLARRAIAAVHTAGLIVADLGLVEFSAERISTWAAEHALGDKS